MNQPSSSSGRSEPLPPTVAGPNPADRAREVDRLFRDHNRELVRFLQVKLRDEGEAREVAQEAYVRLLQLDNTEAISFLRAYLFKIAANLAFDRLRVRGRMAVSRGDVSDELANIADPLDIERAALASEEFDLFLTCLDELPPKCRQVFMLHRIRKLKTQQVADQLGISDRMVRKHISRALIYCRFRLDGLSPTAALSRMGASDE